MLFTCKLFVADGDFGAPRVQGYICSKFFGCLQEVEYSWDIIGVLYWLENAVDPSKIRNLLPNFYEITQADVKANKQWVTLKYTCFTSGFRYYSAFPNRRDDVRHIV